MINKIYIGLDNGVNKGSGVGIIWNDGRSDTSSTPIKKCLSYTKKKNYISRFDVKKFKELMLGWIPSLYTDENHSYIRVGIERPFTSHLPQHKKAMIIGARIHEAQLIAVEQLKLSHEFIDSGEWQNRFLPKGIKGSVELKKASLDIGIRKYPHLIAKLKKDADGLFIAEYMRDKDLNPKTL